MKQWICIWWYDDYPVWYFNALYIWYHVQKLRHNCNHATKAQSMLRAVVMRAPTHSWSSHCTATRSPQTFHNLPNTRINHLISPPKDVLKDNCDLFPLPEAFAVFNEYLLTNLNFAYCHHHDVRPTLIIDLFNHPFMLSTYNWRHLGPLCVWAASLRASFAGAVLVGSRIVHCLEVT